MNIGPVFTLPSIDIETNDKLKKLGLSLRSHGLYYQKLKEGAAITIQVKQEVNNFRVTLNSKVFNNERLMFRAAYEVRSYITSNGREPNVKQLKEIVERCGGDPTQIKDLPPKKIKKKPKKNIKDLILDDKPKISVWNDFWNSVIKGW